MNNIIDDITNLYKSNNGSQSKDPFFWIACLKAQIKEIEDALAEGDKVQALWELSDVAMVAVDGIRKLGADPETMIRYRMSQNSKKDLSGRDKDFYLRKAGLK